QGEVTPAREDVRVAATAERVTLTVSPGSRLLAGAPRVFVVNTLGFDVSEELPGYVLARGSSAVDLLRDAIDYLATQGADIVLDHEAENLVGAVAAEKERLVQAEKIGRELKRRPPR